MAGRVTRKHLETRFKIEQTPSGRGQVLGGPEGCDKGNRPNAEQRQRGGQEGGLGLGKGMS